LADGSDAEKTEDPTSKRLNEAREEGNSPKSREMAAAFIFISMALFMRYYLPSMLESIKNVIREILSIGKVDMNAEMVIRLAYFVVIECAKILAPIMLLLVIMVYTSSVVQVGFLWTPKAIKFDIKKLNPVKGLSNLFSKKSLVELVKSVFKIFVIGYAAFLIIKGKLNYIYTMNDLEPLVSLTILANLIFELFLKIGVLVLIMAIIDYIYQKWQHKQDLKMTKQEVKEEHKQMEGDPKVKSRIRQVQRELARKLMMEDVPKSDVVVTNPTHFAVALRYDIGSDNAPTVVAKGQRLIALRIKEIAKENRILVHEDPPLARTLFKSVEIGEEIPENLYRAVAEILSLVDKFKRPK